jgi:signal transduction histidine kinase
LDTRPQIKILLVDDREDNLFSIEAIFGHEDYQFVKANSGRQALKILLSQQDFSLILMDVQMPDLDGFETASLIYDREKLRHIPIIFITAFDFSDDKIYRGYQAGAVDYIFKPINPTLLKAKVSVFVELYRKNHQLLAQEQKLLAVNNELEERVEQRTEELLRKNLELEGKNVELKKINSDLDNFVYAASHDLKGPMANLEGLINLLSRKVKGKITDEDTQLFSLINHSIIKFNRTLKDLTEITKVQKDLEEEREPVAFEQVVTDIKSDLTKMIAESAAVIEEQYQAAEVMYASKNVRSILYNLLTNGIKYCSPERPPRITVKTYFEGDEVVLTVADNGLGISAEQLPKLFGMFKRLHTHVDGSGIGLYIVKRIIENNGGRITVESELDRGTAFIIRFGSNSRVVHEKVPQFVVE